MANDYMDLSYEDLKKRFTPKESPFWGMGSEGYADLLKNQDYNTEDYLKTVEQPYLQSVLSEYKKTRGEGRERLRESLAGEYDLESGAGFKRLGDFGEETAKGVTDISTKWAYEGIQRKINQDRYNDALKRGDIETAFNIALQEEERDIMPAKEATKFEAVKEGQKFQAGETRQNLEYEGELREKLQRLSQEYGLNLQDEQDKQALWSTLGNIGGGALNYWMLGKMLNKGGGDGGGLWPFKGSGPVSGAAPSATSTATNKAIPEYMRNLGIQPGQSALPGTFLQGIGYVPKSMTIQGAGSKAMADAAASGFPKAALPKGIGSGAGALAIPLAVAAFGKAYSDNIKGKSRKSWAETPKTSWTFFDRWGKTGNFMQSTGEKVAGKDGPVEKLKASPLAEAYADKHDIPVAALESPNTVIGEKSINELSDFQRKMVIPLTHVMNQGMENPPIDPFNLRSGGGNLVSRVFSDPHQRENWMMLEETVKQHFPEYQFTTMYNALQKSGPQNDSGEMYSYLPRDFASYVHGSARGGGPTNPVKFPPHYSAEFNDLAKKLRTMQGGAQDR